MFIDTHAHLNDEKLFANCKQLVLDAKNNGVGKIICASYDYESCKKAIEVSDIDNVYFTLGVHPHDSITFDKDFIEFVNKNKNLSKFVAVGEIGLDYYYDLSPRETQKQVFIEQIKLAYKLNKPIVIHSRDATEDTLKILKEYQLFLKNGFVVHCFSYSLETAKIIYSMGGYISVGGTLTFKNSKSIVEVVKYYPLEKIMLETDCPYLTPEPFRHNVNESKYIPYIAQKIADIKNININEVEKITTENAIKFFKLEN